MSIKCAIYARLSLDPNGEGVAVDRQLQDCRDLAIKRGWTVVQEFRDDSKSAWQRNRKRPGWDSMLEAIQHNKFDAIIVYHGDRLVRQPYDLEMLINIAEDKGLLIASPSSGDYDLGTSDGRMILRMFTVMACRESDSNARRVKRIRELEAKQGKRQGPVPYGWRNEAEAVIVRSIITDLLSGLSLRTIAKTLNDKNIPTARGGKWTGPQVRGIANRWANAGKRTHNGVVVADGQWDALVTVEVQEQVMRLLSDPKRHYGQNGTFQKHLLSFFATCAVCGGPLRGYNKDRYKCNENFCVSLNEEWLDNLTLAFAQIIIDQANVKPDNDDAESQARLKLVSLQSKKDKAADDYADGAFDASQLRRINTRLDAQIVEAEAVLRKFEQKTSTIQPGINIKELDPERQRVILKTLIEKIEVHRLDKETQKRGVTFHTFNEGIAVTEPQRAKVSAAMAA